MFKKVFGFSFFSDTLGHTPTKKPGFLPNLWAATKYFRKKPGFWAPMRKF